MPDGQNAPDAASLIRSAVDYLSSDDPERKVERDYLAEMVARWDKVAPEIDTPERAEKVNDFVVRLRAADQAEEAARVSAKEPILSAGRDIDAAFKGRQEPLRLGLRGMERRQANWLRRERERLAAEAERLRKEAEAKAAAGRKAEAEQLAAAAEQAAAAKPTVRSQSGAMVTTRRVPKVVVVDAAAIPREYLVLDAAKALAALRIGTRIPGLELGHDEKPVTRR